ncbi:ParB N-terminal domain-containing protein [Streptomyces sp900105245]|uniref:ParB N-terminal domain-containing protein n=1 Tax=Streptomyces sp. 900105245 TaxID=3154379 RepID=A0ABV1ULK9_9ACTN
MSHKPGLKRDLAAERAARKAATQQARLVPQGLPTARPDQLMPSPENGRKELHKIDELANTLRTDGMNTAMTVIPPDIFIELYPRHKEAVEARVAEGVLFVVHHGHRRLAAAVKAGLTEVPILVRRDVPSLRIAAIQENLQRMGLNPIEEAEEFQGALDEVDDTGKRLSQRELSKRVGCSQTYVSHRVALLRLIPSLQQAVIDHWLKEQQLLEVPERDSDANARLLLPVRDAAVTYSRLSVDMQEAFVRGELSPAQATTVSKLPTDQQAIPAAGNESDCAAIASAGPETPAPLPEPRASEPQASTVSTSTNQHQTHASAPRLRQPTSNTPTKSATAPTPTAASAPAVRAVEEPRGVIVVRSVEDLALNILELLTEVEVEQLKEHLSY